IVPRPRAPSPVASCRRRPRPRSAPSRPPRRGPTPGPRAAARPRPSARRGQGWRQGPACRRSSHRPTMSPVRRSDPAPPILASHFPDRTVVTYDPRGVERSAKPDQTVGSTPEQHAEDIHRVIASVGGQVDLFTTSGGAVNALALVARHPDDVRTLVAHEPPL